ncbi:MAG: aminotransferase class V-fold PLP-dependent enzyme [Acidimicrobiia bacterium]|nr:aminotransferase class V-fold PLP-dependent enzyme [Acidimicrobiia bacterium]
MLNEWLLTKQILHLNHGSFGATPRVVLAEQSRWRELFQADPTTFVVDRWEPSLDHARESLCRVVGANPESLGFVPNTTTGVNAVLRSFPFAAGDEILTTNHVYNACRNVLEFVAAESEAELVIAPVPFPLSSADEVVAAIMEKVSPRTRFALLDHVTSATGLVLPVDRLVPLLEGLGVAVMVDGAHAPGMVELDIESLAPSYYAGNCHKWLCAPPGSAFLWVRPDRADRVVPTVISHGANDPRTDRPRLHLLFDYPGTIDPSGYLSVPTAIEFLTSLHPQGLEGVMASNRDLALAARDYLCEVVGTPPPAPDDMIGSLAAVILPPGEGQAPIGFIDPLTRVLLEQWGIQVPVFIWPSWPARDLRVSAAPYNQFDDYLKLSAALAAELSRAA